MPVSSLKERLADHPFLAGLAPHSLDFIAECAMTIRFNTAEHILLEGKQANEFFLIEEGEVVLKTFLSPSEGFASIQHLGPGEIVGLSWLVPPHHWHFSAFATKPTTAIILDGQRLREKCEADHDFGYELQKRLMTTIGQRLRMTRMRIG
jgi:CRP-like cAMP-binding protein